MTLDRGPFTVCAPQEEPPSVRALSTAEGLADRLRTAAFAELQAEQAFAWAVERYPDAPQALRSAWSRLSRDEGRHKELILGRMRELGISPGERPVSDRLWRSLTACADFSEFTRRMRSAEERGRAAERRFEEALAERDPATAEIFALIAREEDEHIALAQAALDAVPR